VRPQTRAPARALHMHVAKVRGTEVNKTRFKHGLAAGLVGLTILGTTALPAAAAAIEPSGVAVRFGDLDLNTARGAEKLYTRIVAAAAQVCPAPATYALSRYMVTVRCRREAVDRAVNSIGSPQLAAVYAARAHHGARSPV
jgi:UrcA family protein